MLHEYFKAIDMKTKLTLIIGTLLMSMVVTAQTNPETADTAVSYSPEGYKVIVLSAAVGTTIDQNEKVEYELFEKIWNSDFKSAQILQKENGVYIARIIYTNGNWEDIVMPEWKVNSYKAKAEQKPKTRNERNKVAEKAVGIGTGVTAVVIIAGVVVVWVIIDTISGIGYGLSGI